MGGFPAGGQFGRDLHLPNMNRSFSALVPSIYNRFTFEQRKSVVNRTREKLADSSRFNLETLFFPKLAKSGDLRGEGVYLAISRHGLIIDRFQH